jgi:hypothetical protein
MRNSRNDRPSRDLVGRDLSRMTSRRRRPRPKLATGAVAAALAGLLLAGLSLAALRIDILRLRYALADAVASEKQLLEERRVWTAQKATLSDPARLAEFAEERGFALPKRVIDLRDVQIASGQP